MKKNFGQGTIEEPFEKSLGKKSKAQGTIEYLVIIGIVIVITLVVVGLLVGFLDSGSDVSSNAQNISQKTQLISLGDTIMSPTGDYVLEIQSNEVGTINITRIVTDDGFELFSNESMPLGSKKIFPIYTNENCVEGTNSTKSIVIEYTTRHGLEKTQRFENVIIPCQSVSVESSLDSPLLNINFINPTPQNNSSISSDYFDVNVFSKGSKNISTFIDFNNSLVGWWRMDDYNSTHILDYTGNNHGSFQGGLNSENIVDGKMGKALEFDGSSGSNTSVDHDVLLDISDELTISLWLYSRSEWDGYAVHPISKWSTTENANYVLYYFGTGQLRFYGNRNGIWGSISGAYIIDLDKWYHVVLSRTSSLGGLLYIDGIPRGSLSGPGDLATNTQNLIIGKLDGSIDDVMIFNRALNAEEIQALYANTSEKYLDTNFSDLNNGDYVYTAYSQDTLGNIVQTEERKITINN